MKHNLFFFIVLLLTFSAFCQEQQLAKADNKHENFAYSQTAALYKKLLKKGYRSAEVYQKIGDSYYFNADYKSATPYYKALFGLKKSVPIEYYFRYIQSLKSQGKYKLADDFLKQIPNEYKSDSRYKIFIENPTYLSQIKSNNNFKIDTTAINSPYSDFGGFASADIFYFTSSRDTSGIINRKHSWTNQAFSKIYKAEITDSGSLINAKAVETNFVKALNQSSAIITQDGKTMYFTQNNSENGKRLKNSNQKTLLKIYRATYDGKQWGNAIALPFNSDNFNCAHPSLNLDETFLYFSSDMPGSLGASDIYKVEIFDDGTYGKAENLGDKVNTNGRETFPFISSDHKLYFASDGRAGLGGLDIYVADLQIDNANLKIENLGSEINSAFDDFAFYINPETNKGFFSSNRSTGLGYDDIYKFTKVKDCSKTVEGTVVDNQNQNPIEGVLISLLNQNSEKVKSTITDKSGNYSFENVDCDEIYILNTTKDLYESQEQILKSTGNGSKTINNVVLEESIKTMEVGDDLAKILSIRNIYFDLDKYDIRTDAGYELTKILLILQQEPQMEISIRSHTDSRASKEYNLELSNNRAKSTMNWLIRQGISANRLQTSGFGESQLLNNCKDGIECSEAEHQLNRRSEFIITKI